MRIERRAMVVLLLLLQQPALGEPAPGIVGGREPRFEHITMDHGLSNGNVEAIIQDRRASSDRHRRRAPHLLRRLPDQDLPAGPGQSPGA